MNDNNEKNKVIDNQTDRDTHNPFLDAAGLNSPDNKVASVSLGGFLKGIAKSAHSNVVDPLRYGDGNWLLRKAFYAILTAGGVLLIATLIQYFQNN